MADPNAEHPLSSFFALAEEIRSTTNCSRDAAVTSAASLMVEGRLAEMLEVMDPQPDEDEAAPETPAEGDPAPEPASE